MAVRNVEFGANYKSLVDDFSKPIAVFDDRFMLIYYNKQFELLCGRQTQQLIDLVEFPDQSNVQDIQESIILSGHWEGQLNNRYLNAANHSFRLMLLPNTPTPKYVGVIEGENLRLLPPSAQLSQIDDLTQLPNRYSFLEKLEQRIQLADGQPEFAVVYIDLDHFKDINELYGHETGDELLKLCADKIRQMLRKEDALARLSGDEFAAIVDCGESHEMQFLCHRIMRYFDRPVFMGGQRFQFTVSMGVVFYPEQGSTARELVVNAEKAMFSAKTKGRAQFQLFDRKQSQKTEKQHRIAESLRHVLSSEPEQFSAAYQPLYQLQTGEFIGVEVLARWHSPEFGNVSPGEFVTLAESRGLINALTSRIFSIIERDILVTTKISGNTRPLLAVNVTAQQIGDPVFEAELKRFHKIVEASGWQLELELTESQLMTLSDSLIQQLEAWRQSGLRIAIDDFGTGYSCLAYLHMLPVNKLKIDRQFLQTKTEARKEDQIMYAIMSMAKALNIEVLAEGIETRDHFDRLQKLGCMTGQGFGLARPQPWHPRLMRPLNKI